MGRLNRSACRSYIKVSSTHQRVGLIFFHPCIGRPLVRDSNLEPFSPEPFSPESLSALSPFPRGGDSRDVKDHRSPRRGTGFASDTKTLTEGGPCPESTTSPCQRLARGLGSGLKPLLKDKKGLGLLVTLQGGTLQKRGYGGSPHPRARSRNYFLIKLAIETNMVASDAIEVPMPSH